MRIILLSRRRLAMPALTLLFLASFVPPGLASEGRPPGDGSPRRQAPPPMSMERWRELKQEAEEATEAPRGDERIAKCEAFLSLHPDYPELQFVLASLVDAYLDKGDFDPAHLASLLERQWVAGSPYGPG